MRDYNHFPRLHQMNFLLLGRGALESISDTIQSVASRRCLPLGPTRSRALDAKGTALKDEVLCFGRVGRGQRSIRCRQSSVLARENRPRRLHGAFRNLLVRCVHFDGHQELQRQVLFHADLLSLPESCLGNSVRLRVWTRCGQSDRFRAVDDSRCLSGLHDSEIRQEAMETAATDCEQLGLDHIIWVHLLPMPPSFSRSHICTHCRTPSRALHRVANAAPDQCWLSCTIALAGSQRRAFLDNLVCLTALSTLVC